MRKLCVGIVVVALLVPAMQVGAQEIGSQPTRKRVTVLHLKDGTTAQGRFIRRIPAGVILQGDKGRRFLVDGDWIRRFSSKWETVRPLVSKKPPKPLKSKAWLHSFPGKTRFDLGLALGVNICLNIGDVNCVGRKALPRGELSLSFRLREGLMVGVDIAFGGLTSPYSVGTDGVQSTSLLVLHALPTIKYLAESGRLRFTVAAGFGYGVLFYSTKGVNLHDGEFESTGQESGVAVRAGLSIGSRVSSAFALSLQVNYIWQSILSACVEESWTGDGKICDTTVVGTTETTPSEKVALHLFTTGLVATFSFGL